MPAVPRAAGGSERTPTRSIRLSAASSVVGVADDQDVRRLQVAVRERPLVQRPEQPGQRQRQPADPRRAARRGRASGRTSRT